MYYRNVHNMEAEDHTGVASGGGGGMRDGGWGMGVYQSQNNTHKKAAFYYTSCAMLSTKMQKPQDCKLKLYTGQEDMF